jgi:hypothetical protein
MASSRKKSGSGGSKAKASQPVAAAQLKTLSGGEAAGGQPGNKSGKAVGSGRTAQQKAEAPKSTTADKQAVHNPVAAQPTSPPVAETRAAPVAAATPASGRPAGAEAGNAARSIADIPPPLARVEDSASVQSAGAPQPEPEQPDEWAWLTEPLKGIHQLMRKPLFDRKLVFGALSGRDPGRSAAKRGKTGS